MQVRENCTCRIRFVKYAVQKEAHLEFRHHSYDDGAVGLSLLSAFCFNLF